MAMRMAAVSRAIAGSQGAKGRSRTLHKVPHVPRKALETRRTDRNASCAAFFGVGAPEAIVVGAVALLVFGPQGLAQAAKALGATLKSLAPTIRELQEVSTDFRSTLEKEIGMEEIGSFTSTSSFLANNAAKSSMESSRSFMDEKPMDDPLQFEADEEVEGAEKVEATDAEGREPTEQVGEMGEELSLDEMRKKSQDMAWNASNVEPTESEEQRLAEDEFSLEEIQAEIQRRKKLSALSLEELEAKLEHRKGNKEDDNATNRTEM
eukprot:scaffold988_cov393-Pavlova_lutheri.AAC.1